MSLLTWWKNRLKCTLGWQPWCPLGCLLRSNTAASQPQTSCELTWEQLDGQLDCGGEPWSPGWGFSWKSHFHSCCKKNLEHSTTFKFRDSTRNKKWMLHVFTVENLIILILEEGNQLGRLFHFQQTPVLSKVAYFHLGTIGKLKGNFLKLPTSFFSAICFCTPPSP